MHGPCRSSGTGPCGEAWCRPLRCVATRQRPPCSEPPGRAPCAQAAAQGVSSAIQNLARSPGPPGAPSAPVPVAFEKQPFRASDYGQGADSSSGAGGSASGTGGSVSGAGAAPAAGSTGAGRRLQVAAHWLGALGVSAGRRLLQLPLPPQPQPGGAPGGPGGPQDAGGAATPPVRQSWAEVVQQSTPYVGAGAPAPPQPRQQRAPGAALPAAAAPAPAPAALAPNGGIAFWLPPLTVQGHRLPAVAIPALPAAPPPPPGAAAGTPLEGAGRPQSFLQARPGQLPPALPGLSESSRLISVGLGGASGSAGRH